ncbi:MAG: gas vesicle protein K [Pseudomonadota bacterium]
MSDAPAFAIDPAQAERDLARLVLALMEALRELMELQALRQMEAGALDEPEQERVGTALARSRAAIRSVAAEFGLEEADLELSLGEILV